MRYFVECRFAPCSESERLAVRHGVEVVETDGIWRESFAPGCWLVGGTGARVTLGHDGRDVGYVVCVIPRDGWHYADLVLEDDEPLRIRNGHPVSIDARSIKRSDDEFIHLRRHTLAQLQAIALVLPGDVPCYADAKITRVREVPAPVHHGELDGDVITTHGTIVREGSGVILGVR